MRCGLLFGGAVATAILCAAANAQVSPEPPAPSAAVRTPKPPTPDTTTHHTLELPGRTLRFAATAGFVRLPNDKGAPRADIAFIAYQQENADPLTRRVTFVLNGGPGFASGWLQVGAVGPWRIPFAGGPSASAALLPNPETWLDFTDLVFIDPADTGFSRVLDSDPEARKKLFSVEGDIASLAEAIRRWLDRAERNVSPKYILGESYGGFRGPRLARALASDQGTGIRGLILLSPALDLGGRSAAFDPLSFAEVLPSMTAATRAGRGAVSRADLTDVEQYAAGDYVVDALKGERDAAAIARRARQVAAFTGLDPALVARYHGSITVPVFLHERERAAGRVGSFYDVTTTIADPFPLQPISRYPDPDLDGLQAPVSSAMATIYETKLKWRPDNEIYRLQSPIAFKQWDWGRGMYDAPQSVLAMRGALALDPRLHVLIAHGLFDLVTPYFFTQLLLNQIPESGGADRVRLVTYPGGHMFYSVDASRRAFREEARTLFEAD